MAFRFTLYNEPPTATSHTVWKNVVCGTVTYFDKPLYVTSRTVDGKVIKIIDDVLLHARGVDPEVPVVSATDNIVQYPSTSYVSKYTAGKFSIGVTGYRREASLGHWVSKAGAADPEYDNQLLLSTTVVTENDEYSTSVIGAFVYAYELTYEDENYIYFSTYKVTDGVGLVGFGISENAFEGALTPRVVPVTEPDPDGGFPTGSTPSGDQDGTVINVNNGGDTVNVAPPNVSVGVQVNMPEPDPPIINHPAGIHLALVDDTALGHLENALWGRNPQGFNDLWLQFQNYSFNPVKGIISCLRLPRWVIEEATPASGSPIAIGIAGTTVEGFNGIPITTGACVQRVFSTAAISQFNSFKDFVGVTIRAYAPFVGWFELDPNVCLGLSTSEGKCKISFHYSVDVTNGNVGVTIWGNTTGKNDTQTHGTPIASGSGNCAYPLLLSASDKGIGDVVGGFVQMFGGAASVLTGIAAGNVPLAASGGSNIVGGMFRSSYPQQHTMMIGGVSGSVGYLNYSIPFIHVIKPRYVEPEHYNEIYGSPSYASGGTGTVGDFAGYYGEFDVHADDINYANASEQKKIIDLLANGVYV